MTDRPLPIYRRSLAGWVPHSTAAQERFERTKIGELVALEARKPRNIKWHRRYWELCTLVSQAHDQLDTSELVHAYFKAATGLAEWIYVNGCDKPLVKYGSISFGEMSADEWALWYDQVIRITWRHLIPGLDENELRRQIEDIAV